MPKSTDKCLPLTNLYYGNCVDCYCAHQPGHGVGAGLACHLVAVFKEGKGNPTRAGICIKLNGKKT